MDAFLLLSYGAPERRADVRPFLNNILAGKSVSPRRIEQVAERYDGLALATGSFSPLPGECRDLIAGLLAEFRHENQSPLPVYWGNLFWEPFLAETLNEMSRDGVRRAFAFATNAFPSEPDGGKYARYLRDAGREIESRGLTPPDCTLAPPCWEHPLFAEAVADRIFEALAHLELEPDFEPLIDRARTTILFTAHSVPDDRHARDVYDRAVRDCCRRVMEHVSVTRRQGPPAEPASADFENPLPLVAGIVKKSTILDVSNTKIDPPAEQDDAWTNALFAPASWELAYQSRSGRPEDPWLGPDIDERIDALARDGSCKTVLLVPVGFFCENMETAYDLDCVAAECCERLGLRYARARTVAGSPKILRMIGELFDACRSIG